MENINLLFYKLFYEKYENNKFCSIKENVKELIESKFYCDPAHTNKEDYIKLGSMSGQTQSFCLKTLYPGLMAGTGYAHGVSDEDDIKTGFSLDYVTGQPYIPGSSIKGVIRDAYEKGVFNEIAMDSSEPLGKLLNNKEKKADDNPIFTGGVVFFDAVILHGDADGHVFKSDAITPHTDPIKAPIPIHTLVIRPNVVFEFRFLVKDELFESVEDAPKLKEELIKIFAEAIELLGVGAKTNVGYGNMEICDDKNYKALSYREESDNPVRFHENHDTPHDNGRRNNSDRPYNNNRPQNNNRPDNNNPKIIKQERNDANPVKVPLCRKCNKNQCTWNSKRGEYNNLCEKCFSDYLRKNKK